MRTIHKFELAFGDRTDLRLPPGSIILDVQMQRDTAVLWVELDDRDGIDKLQQVFHLVGTGHDVPSSSTYVGTFQQSGGLYVWHVYKEVDFEDSDDGIVSAIERFVDALIQNETGDGWGGQVDRARSVLTKAVRVLLRCSV